jgi:hypothetical protein
MLRRPDPNPGSAAGRIMNEQYPGDWTGRGRDRSTRNSRNGCPGISHGNEPDSPAAAAFRSAGGEIPAGMDVDHIIDLQLGGADEVANMTPLDSSVNRSLGPQIAAQLRGVPIGTCVIGVQIC